MTTPDRSALAIIAAQAPLRLKPSNYPEPFASKMQGRLKRPLGDLFGLTQFGVNHVTLPPGTVSALFHRHSVQDEGLLVLTGQLMLVHDTGETLLVAGMFVGFPKNGSAHQLKNCSAEDATYLEIGDRSPHDAVSYPRDDLIAQQTPKGWVFTHKDGRPYPE